MGGSISFYFSEKMTQGKYLQYCNCSKIERERDIIYIQYSNIIYIYIYILFYIYMVSRALRKERKNNVALSQNGPVAPDHAL